jgi:uncharacterized protein (DUF4415 family)
MRNEYDFTDSKTNPYIKKLKKQISIRLDVDVIDYFKKVSIESDVPYQQLINMYLSDCVAQSLKHGVVWKRR